MKTYYGLNKDSVYNKYFYIYGYSLSINDHQKPEDKESAPYRFLADEEMIKVMDCIIDRSKSFNDVVAENSDISRTTAFRKTRWLLKEGLIIVDKIILTPDGKKFSLYHSTLKAINAKYEANNISVEAEPNFDIAKKWIEKFFSLD